MSTSKDTLTKRELQIVELISDGFTNKQIAEQLHISDKTVGTQRKRIIAKLELPNTAALVKHAMRKGWIE